MIIDGPQLQVFPPSRLQGEWLRDNRSDHLTYGAAALVCSLRDDDNGKSESNSRMAAQFGWAGPMYAVVMTDIYNKVTEV